MKLKLAPLLVATMLVCGLGATSPAFAVTKTYVFRSGKFVEGSGTADEAWVAIGSGAAIKWPATLMSSFDAPNALPPDFDSLEDLGL